MSCPDWSDGWCHAEGTKYVDGCVGIDHCEYMQEKKQRPRIDIIGSNGGDGEHYLVEAVARAICGDDADMRLGGKHVGEARWEIYILPALRAIEAYEKEKSNGNF